MNRNSAAQMAAGANGTEANVVKERVPESGRQQQVWTQFDTRLDFPCGLVLVAGLVIPAGAGQFQVAGRLPVEVGPVGLLNQRLGLQPEA